MAFLGVHLKCAKAEKGDANVSVSVVLDFAVVTAEFETGRPSRNADDISGGLASNVKIKPCRVRRFEHSHVPCYYSTQRHQYTPTHCI